MKTLSIDEAISRHGGNSLREVVANMARSGEYHDIWLYANVTGGGYTAPYTHFLCASKSDETRQVVAFLMRRDVSHDTRVFEKGALTKLADPELDRAIVRETPVDIPEQSEKAEKDKLNVQQSRAITSAWYFAKSESKHARQVVITLPPEAAVLPKVSNLVTDFGFMQANWAATVLFLTAEDPQTKGPSIFAKASGVIDRVRGDSASLVFAFYRLARGGIFQIFIQVDNPAIHIKPRLSGSSRPVQPREPNRRYACITAASRRVTKG